VRRGAAALGLGVGVLAMSWGAPLARLTAAAPLAVAMWRMTLATGLLLPVAAARGGWQAVTRRRGAALLAGAFLGLHFGLWIPSLWLTSVSASVVLVATQPLFVLLLSPRLLGVPIRTVNLLSFAVAIVGVSLISWGDLQVSSRALLGDAMALGGAAAGAGYVVVGKRLRSDVPLDRYLTVVYGGAAVVLVCGVAVLSVPPWPFDAISWLPLLAMAAGPTLTGHTLLNWALAYLEAYKVNLALLLEPVLASLWTWLVLAQAPPLHVLPGAVLVLFALGLEYRPRGATLGPSGGVAVVPP
jgi:drug/metabolite transporter (DMT)-like permease